uniref:Globin family profile domain-containing protein n=1 Tax=Acrobeloides nanus TaxID=290746 RepID=A0A914CY70_9BILA
MLNYKGPRYQSGRELGRRFTTLARPAQLHSPTAKVSVTSYDPTSSTSVPVVVYPLSEPNELTSSYFEEEQFAEGEEYDLFEMDIPEVPKSEQENEEEIIEFQDEAETEAISSSRSNKNETIPENEPKITETPRRSVTDIDRRRMSLQQRRLSNVQLVQSVSGRRHSTTLIPLTCAQIHLVRALWRQVYLTKGPTVIGQTIIHKLFFKCTKTKEQFKRCPLPRSFPNHDSFSKAHCKAVAELIDQVVENLDNLENMSPDLEKLGRVHAQIMGGMLSSKLWNNVAETFIDCTLEWGDRRCRSETVRKAWALIIAFMVERIKVGHVEQRKQLLTLRSNAVSLDRSTASNHMRVTFV